MYLYIYLDISKKKEKKKIYIYIYKYLYLYQCSKLRVHSAPGAHISAAGRTFLGRVRPMAHIFSPNFHCNILEECTG